ncbi:GNAT family N-acetyltransferase [Roseibacterium sp. SDUM158017]|uniref:GNAT family N-acetyltransferase n=1 Tax=Roseicyclus salinarum TaxID=3036773 RepID=UPI002414EB64|nr:GNAT family N-acetyltransferase [Roseibacterium sp. SDUM158017]MDG4648096.1 GNAT family N-acetyltransferase [Roseibacterium sp. SDUM158017]
MRGLVVRDYRPDDAGPIARVFHRAVRRGTSAHYSLAQRLAWSPRVQAPEAWHTRLSQIETVVAETGEGPVGFMALDLADGFLDFAYVDPSVRGMGVGAAIYAVIEGRARAAGLTRLQTEASRVAEPFFDARGWIVVKRQRVRRNGLSLPNAVMERTFAAGEVAA